MNKLHVLALREIVSDLGVDRGIILCEVGFQSGAFEAAHLTNIQVSSLNELSITSSEAIASARLKDLFDRNKICGERYWEIPKGVRIENGLRPGFQQYDVYYSGAFIVEVVEKYLGFAFRGVFPITVEWIDHQRIGCKIPETFNTMNDVFSTFEPIISELEQKLDAVKI